MKIVIFDIAKTPKAQTTAANFGFECCESNGRAKLSQRFSNHHCLPIDVPRNDEFLRGEKCMNFIRAMVTHDECEINEAKIVRKFLNSNFCELFVASSSTPPLT